jgi:hypothetical protein
VPRKSKVEKSEKHRWLIKGVKKHWMKSGPMVFAGKTYTPAQVVERLQSFIEEQDQTARKRAEWRGQVARERALEKELAPLVRGVENLVASLFGERAQQGADFGIKKGKPGPKTLPAEVEMVAKARATRTARGTRGKRQRAKIKG